MPMFGACVARVPHSAVCLWQRVACFFCRENSREFGVLRALGLSVGQVSRVFLYEAVSVVMSSFILGTSIGV